jgi:hypothetical protein
MLKKIAFYLLGFGLGIFMLFNSMMVLYQFLAGIPWNITPAERLFSSGITFLVGLILIIWTYLLRKKSQ